MWGRASIMTVAFNYILVIQFSNSILSLLFMFKLNVCDEAQIPFECEGGFPSNQPIPVPETRPVGILDRDRMSISIH